jgi:hypothetical protein
MMLASAHHHGRQQDIRLGICLRLQIGHDGKLGEIVFRLAHHLLEQIICDLDLGKVEIDQI